MFYNVPKSRILAMDGFLLKVLGTEKPQNFCKKTYYAS